MWNIDATKPFFRLLFTVLGMAIMGLGFALLRNGRLFYRNWWGDLVFAPVLIFFGAAFVLGALFKPSIFKS